MIYTGLLHLKPAEPEYLIRHIIVKIEETEMAERDYNFTDIENKWQKIWEGHRPGDKDERLRLYQLRPPKPSPR